jgi:hypothetical protein
MTAEQMGPNTDRTVHAWGESGQLVRYDRAGKWYFEQPDEDNDPEPREHLTLKQAVAKAIWLWYHDNGTVEFGRTGGKLFDKRVRDGVA